ncbi:hypothetical protein Q9R38_13550 [Priestia aryabhattai]|uniref:hypothetical protein n=1 Tax=Priestia TaxID=2800373 RepID=UPI00064ACE7B|nr:hypothetical protein [Priestia aryabhattai]MDT0147540.1 hypothetical protein [Priestia aryabhattai]MDT0152129.1 hypothetical protein [Priestia aryabhattai]
MVNKERRNNVVGGIILGIITLGLLTLYITDFINDKKLNLNSILGIVLLLIAWLQFSTWGSDKKVQKDEMGKKIAAISAKTSYHILTIALFVLWVLDRIIFVRRNDFGNISLFAAICLSLIIFPIVQFFSARRYR